MTQMNDVTTEELAKGSPEEGGPGGPVAPGPSSGSATASHGQEPAGRRELRLCLVLNGGVSLAVWMGGVTRTIDEIRTARAFSDGAPRIAKAWNAILDAASVSRVTVDLVAGTSAGGLNGAVLATAVANRRCLPDMKGLWVEQADLKVKKLISDNPTASRSLLDGAFFAERVSEVLGCAAGAATSGGPEPGAQLPDDIPSDCTLLVTATALSSTPPSSGPGALAARDSRRVYRFRQRAVVPPGSGPTAPEGWVVDDFKDHAADLALAGRASASFPVAFSPVYESKTLFALRVVGDGLPSHLADGGILDNAPFEPLLKALRDRPVDGPFERLMVYVKPSVSSSAPPVAGPSQPDVAAVMGRVISASREPDERLDMEALDRAHQLMKFEVSRPHRLIADGLGIRLGHRGCTPAAGDGEQTARRESRTAFVALARDAAMFDVYRRSRVEAARILLEESDRPHPVVLTCDDLPCLPYVPASFGPPAQDGRWDWGVSTAARVVRWWSRLLAERDAPLPSARRAEGGMWETLAGAQRRLTVLSESMRHALESASADAAGELAAWYTDARTAAIRDTVFDAARAVAGELGVSVQDLMEVSLAIEVTVIASGWQSIDSLDVPTFTNLTVTPGAPSLLDLEAAGQEPRWSERKLYGTRWGHFGAFATKDGREHDWLWGRLDAASEFSNFLLKDVEKDRRKKLQDELCSAVLESEMPGGPANPTAGNASDADAVRAALVAERAAAVVGGGDRLFEDFATGLDGATRDALEALLWSMVRKNLPDPGRQWVLAALAPAAELEIRPEDLPVEGSVPPARPDFGTRVMLRLVRWYGIAGRWYLRKKINDLLNP